MGDFFSIDAYGPKFRLFGTAHLLSLGIILLIILLIYFQRKTIQEGTRDRILRYTMFTILLINQIAYYYWNYFNDVYAIDNALPLNLSGASIFLSMYLLLTKKYAVYEVLYFWGLAGALQALITPEIRLYGFMHFRFHQFFIGHGLIIVVVFYMTFIHNYRPVLKSIKKAFIASNILAAFVFTFNLVFKSNYMFLRHKPEAATLLDYLGPWPWYILSLEVMAILFFFIVYAPFGIKDLKKRS